MFWFVDLYVWFFQVTWVEHWEYDESVVHELYRPLIRTGMGFGAQRWVAALQRQCECLAIIMSSTVPTRDHTGIHLFVMVALEPYMHIVQTNKQTHTV